MSLRQRSRTSPVLVILLSLLFVALIAVAAYLLMTGAPADEDGIRAVFQVEGLDPAAQTGQPPGTPREEKPKGSDQFAYRINTAPVFRTDGTDGKILVQNPGFNDYLLVLEIAGEDGTLLYQSQFIAPNQYIEQIDLQTPVESGDFSATAYINAVDPKTLNLVQAFECPIHITVK